MNKRQDKILKLIINEFIRHAEPIGSKYIAEFSDLGVSPATIRNDMSLLEDEGYLRQPHTSSGRIPTEKAYLYYLKNFVNKDTRDNTKGRLSQAVKEQEAEKAIKNLAKTLVDLSGEMAIVAHNSRLSYYTGISNLMSKPDFHDLSIMRALSGMIDRFDDVVEEIFDQVQSDPQVFIGSSNPFGEGMSSIMVKYSLPDGRVGMIGLVGPMRMDYKKNIKLIERAKEVLDQYE